LGGINPTEYTMCVKVAMNIIVIFDGLMRHPLSTLDNE